MHSGPKGTLDIPSEGTSQLPKGENTSIATVSCASALEELHTETSLASKAATQGVAASSDHQTLTTAIEEAEADPTVPVVVQYCPNCGLPPDFCEYGDQWEKCCPWVLEHFPQYYPTLTSDMKNLSITADSPTKSKRGGGATKKPVKPVVQQVIIHKSLRSKRKIVTSVTGLETFGLPSPSLLECIYLLSFLLLYISTNPSIDSISHPKSYLLDSIQFFMGVNLSKAAKIFAKFFSCGVSVVKSPLGNDQLDIQVDRDISSIG
ncbi:translation initiation factor sui1 protein [Cardiosporidium cionae]|uniref:Translation initiation factor sui1 protein n=1 Tax=Cardiosporidium cionae TaxID=476202 RepID=A0ABQ7J855_9APIC|nr:translation initiation factor sui1 protein [Cardiosporidium cionae]|eukprot:KAF8820143.1 translation initiation factor sui1 protein [Cardiosporidium cionae]